MRTAFEVAMFGWLAIGILLLLPVVLPVLPIEAYLRYQAHLPFVVPKSEHNQDTAILPQHYADEFGWEDMVARVARVYHSLSPEEQSRTAIFAEQLWGSRRHRFFWQPLRLAESDMYAPELFSLGTAQLYRRNRYPHWNQT